MKLLFVEDQKDLREIVSDYLKSKGLEVDDYPNGQIAYDAFMQNYYDLAIVDVMMPIMDGFTLCKKMKEVRNIPVVFLSAKVLESDQLKGYELGCDEYIMKPISLPVLYAKCNAILQRKINHTILSYKDLKLDLSNHSCMIDHEPVALQTVDFKLLEYLLSNQDQILSREQVIMHVFGYDYEKSDRTVDTHIKNLRKKLGPYAACIKTIYKQGYSFKSEGK